MENRKYISEVDILDKNLRIDIIIGALELIICNDIVPEKAINIISDRFGIETDKVLRLMPNIIIEIIKKGA